MIATGEAWQLLFSGEGFVNNVSNFIIRPPRCTYTYDDLGPSLFRVGDDGSRRYDRTDFELENMRGMKLQCSWFRPFVERQGERRERRPCVVYCHANCGGRYDGLEALYLLEKGFTLFVFDFCGSGMSDGEYISLGFYERQDLAVVVEFLQSKTFEVDGVALWGRSMGAVTAVMYAAKDPSIRCIVCDSPFASLRLLIQDLVLQHGGRAGQLIPTSVVNMIVGVIRRRITKRAAFDIDDLDTVKYAALCTVPTLIFHGSEDDFVSPQQSMRVQRAVQGPCIHELTPGGHNDERDEDMQSLIAAFLQLYMVEKPQGQREMRELRLARQRALEEQEQADLAAAIAASLHDTEVAPEASGKAVVRGAEGHASASPSSPSTHMGTQPVATAAAPRPSLVRASVVTPSATDGPVLVGTPKQPAEPPAGRAPVFSQMEEHRPIMRAAESSTAEPTAKSNHTTATSTVATEEPSENKKVTRELGTGQTGPISFTKPPMRDAGSEAAADARTSLAPSVAATATAAAASATAPSLSTTPASSMVRLPMSVEDESVLIDAQRSSTSGEHKEQE